jgi:N-acetylglutamate synthase-like GNAT family acetyltransferase
MSEIGRRDGYEVSRDPARLDLDVIHGYLTRSYWSPGISRALVERAMRHSLCYGLYAPGGGQVGYARIITDYTGFAYLADVFVIEEHRGAGRGTWLVECAVQDPELASVRRFLLFTRDAHGLYAKFGFTALPHPERAMLRPGPGAAS